MHTIAKRAAAGFFVRASVIAIQNVRAESLMFWRVEFYDRPGYSQEQQALIDYARLTTQSLHFLATVECESNRRHEIQSELITASGVREDSHGLCQWNRTRRADILDDPNFANPYRQIDTCADFYHYRTHMGTLETYLAGSKNANICKQNFVRRMLTPQEAMRRLVQNQATSFLFTP